MDFAYIESLQDFLNEEVEFQNTLNNCTIAKASDESFDEAGKIAAAFSAIKTGIKNFIEKIKRFIKRQWAGIDMRYRKIKIKVMTKLKNSEKLQKVKVKIVDNKVFQAIQKKFDILDKKINNVKSDMQANAAADEYEDIFKAQREEEVDPKVAWDAAEEALSYGIKAKSQAEKAAERLEKLAGETEDKGILAKIRQLASEAYKLSSQAAKAANTAFMSAVQSVRGGGNDAKAEPAA